ncbi:hypothetical protein LI328DRAFT_170412 [Trichoderma asperelloides]|nr:hypothetical protein LI328DRAFT_170412 [Trichoderma asperelloides]
MFIFRYRAILTEASVFPCHRGLGSGLYGLISYSLYAVRPPPLESVFCHMLCRCQCMVNPATLGKVGESRKLNQVQGLEAQTNTNAQLWIVLGPSRHGKILLSLCRSQRRACASKLKMPVHLALQDSLILAMYMDKLPNVHCSRVVHKTPPLSTSPHTTLRPYCLLLLT